MKNDEGWWFQAVEGFWYRMDGQRELMDIIECRVAFATEKWVGTDYERGRRKSSNIYANIKLKQHKSFHQNEEFSQLQFIKKEDCFPIVQLDGNCKF